MVRPHWWRCDWRIRQFSLFILAYFQSKEITLWFHTHRSNKSRITSDANLFRFREKTRVCFCSSRLAAVAAALNNLLQTLLSIWRLSSPDIQFSDRPNNNSRAGLQEALNPWGGGHIISAIFNYCAMQSFFEFISTGEKNKKITQRWFIRLHHTLGDPCRRV